MDGWLGAAGTLEVRLPTSSYVRNSESTARLSHRLIPPDCALHRELRPLRTPLQAKLSKRCPVCTHILIKPEQKSSSTRYKIKLVAANYLPSISVYRRPPASIGSRLSAIAAGTASGMRRTQRTGAAGRGTGVPGDDEPLRPGRTYTFELSFVNPLYEPIHVRLAVARPAAPKATAAPPAEGVQGTAAAPGPPFAVNLPSPTFPIAAYAEDWEYEDQDDQDDLAEEDEAGAGAEGDASGRASPTKRKRRGGPGIVERRTNRTTVVMEVAIGRDASGPQWVRRWLLLWPSCRQSSGPTLLTALSVVFCTGQHARHVCLPGR